MGVKVGLRIIHIVLEKAIPYTDGTSYGLFCVFFLGGGGGGVGGGRGEVPAVCGLFDLCNGML